MENNIVTIDTNNYSIMAKAMGMEVDTNSSDKSGSLARLKIEHKPIMGTAEVKGKSTNVEVVPGGSYKLDVPDKGTFYSETVTIRPFIQRFMYKRFISNANAKPGEPLGKYQKTSMSDNLSTDLKDNIGDFNCGKPTGYIKDWNALSEESRKLYQSIKRVRVVFGLVSFDNAVCSNGNSMILDDTPFIWEIDNKDAFKIVGEPIAKLGKVKRLPVQHLINFSTEQRQIPTGAVFYTPVTSLDMSKTVEITDKDQTLFGDFLAWVQNYNDYINSQWEEKARSSISKEDKDTVEGFMEIQDA